jgi:hypothetical protein
MTLRVHFDTRALAAQVDAMREDVQAATRPAAQAGAQLLYDAVKANVAALGRLGLLQSFLYRAVRIVVDTGMHWKGWSRAQAIEYMAQTVGLARGAVENEIDRYCVWPGQACGYKIGHSEILSQRERAKAALKRWKC